jgi:hypothetical protein
MTTAMPSNTYAKTLEPFSLVMKLWRPMTVLAVTVSVSRRGSAWFCDERAAATREAPDAGV